MKTPKKHLKHLKDRAAERAVEAYLALEGWPEVHPARRSLDSLPGGEKRTRSHDLFGCFDLLAAGTEVGTWAIQVTTPANAAKRRKKIEGRSWPRLWAISVIVVYSDGPDYVLREQVLSSRGHWFNPEYRRCDKKKALAALSEHYAAKRKWKKKPKKGSALAAAAEEAKERRG